MALDNEIIEENLLPGRDPVGFPPPHPVPPPPPDRGRLKPIPPKPTPKPEPGPSRLCLRDLCLFRLDLRDHIQ